MEGVKLVDVKHLPRALKFPLVYLIRNLLAKKTDFPRTETKEQTTVKLSQIFFNCLCQFCCHIFAKHRSYKYVNIKCIVPASKLFNSF